jgi:hypothetical protein
MRTATMWACAAKIASITPECRMSDLEAEIRQAVAEARTQLCNGDDLMADALLAVLEEHAASEGDSPVCGRCTYHHRDRPCLPMPDPCPTKLAIAKALGIEVPR